MEPKMPCRVEIMFDVRSHYDLWWWEEESYQRAISEAQILEDRGFTWRILDADNNVCSPNLLPRFRKAA